MTEANPSAQLRAAAQRLRELATGAAPAPWTAHKDGLVWAERLGDPVSGSTEPEDAAYIAAMHPGVALALVELLERIHANHHLDIPGDPWRDAELAAAADLARLVLEER